jgi:NAD(P)-dependent dehydrogenase (short-subunit alcohol dehydrogenase family)
MTPLRRLASPADIAGAIAFFASDDSSFMTGIYAPVDGGRTM